MENKKIKTVFEEQQEIFREIETRLNSLIRKNEDIIKRNNIKLELKNDGTTNSN